MPNAPRVQSREMGHRLGHEIGQRCHAQRRLIKVGVLKEHVHPNGHFALQRIGLSNLRQALAPDIDLASGRHLGWADAITAQAERAGAYVVVLKRRIVHHAKTDAYRTRDDIGIAVSATAPLDWAGVHAGSATNTLQDLLVLLAF